MKGDYFSVEHTQLSFVFFFDVSVIFDIMRMCVRRFNIASCPLSLKLTAVTGVLSHDSY